MKQITLSLFIVLVSLTAYCQKSISLKLSPLTLMDDISFPTIQAGVEYNFSENLSWYNEFGIKYRRSTYDRGWDTLFAPSKGFKFKTELRYYLNDDPFSFLKKKHLFKNAGDPYIACNFFCTSDSRTNGVVYFYRRDTARELTDVYNASKKVYGFNFLIGKQRDWGKNFELDTYLGGGARFRKFKTSQQEFDPDLDYWLTPIDLNIPTIFTEAEVKQKHDVTGNFSFGIRICYRL